MPKTGFEYQIQTINVLLLVDGKTLSLASAL